MPEAIFDGHNDVLTAADHELFSKRRPEGHLDLPRMLAGGMRGGIFAICTPSPELTAAAAETAAAGADVHAYAGSDVHAYAGADGLAPPVDHEVAAAFSTAVAGRLYELERAGSLRIARTIADLDAARTGEGPPVAVLHFEGAEAIDPELESLEQWYAAGLRSLGPVWSRTNRFARGAPIAGPAPPDRGPGLTPAGVSLVRACARLGIMVDLSHMNETGFWDVARIEPGPLVASHSAAYAISPSARNLSDEQIDQVAASDGLVGIVFGSRFVRPDCAPDPDTELSWIVAHARYVADRAGVEHVALGSDFDGTVIPDSLGGVEGLPRLLNALSDSGFTQAELRAIAWENWRRVLAAWWGC